MCLKTRLNLVSIHSKSVATKMVVRKIAAPFQPMGVQGFGENLSDLDHLLQLFVFSQITGRHPLQSNPGDSNNAAGAAKALQQKRIHERFQTGAFIHPLNS